MTQLPLLNFAQLLAAHGAPLMPAQLTALMVALQNLDGNGNSRVGNSCDQVSAACKYFFKIENLSYEYGIFLKRIIVDKIV